MSETDYLHGYTPEEQRRLVSQAEYWREPLIPLGLDYRPGQRVLEVGCGAGAVLGVLAQLFPGIEVAGIDLEPRQIEFARAHLPSLGVAGADLRVGDAAQLPWPDASFDHVYVMWVLEHLRDSGPLLREALRVLRPGGRIAVTETDYTTFGVWPPSDDWRELARAQHDTFAQHGDPVVGRKLGGLLVAAGFTQVTSAPCGFHHFAGDGTDGLRGWVEYALGFLEPAIEPMARATGADPERMRRGFDHVRSLPERDGAAVTQIVYRAHGRRAAE